MHAGDKEAKIESAIIEKLRAHLDAGKPAITAELAPEEKAIARGFFLLTSKPTIFACNVAEADLANVVAIVSAAKDNEGIPPSENVELTDAARSSCVPKK